MYDDEILKREYLNNFLKGESNSTIKESAEFKDPLQYSSDGNGLPYSQVHNNHEGKANRNIISWYIPEYGIVKMYVNPNSITYNDKKIINESQTKGGFTFQYWGEDLTRIAISGTTGSSGIEGINMLHEMYRAEQYAFDAVGLTLAANTQMTDLASQIVGGVGGIFGEASGSALNSLLGTDSPNKNLGPRNIMSLAQLAFGIEMYYSGWAYRGYFQNMTFSEKADNFLMDYQINFVATQRRGYRFNSMPWNRAANRGPSQNNTPYSFNGNKVTT